MFRAQIRLILSQWNSPSIISEIYPGCPSPHSPQKLFHDTATIYKVSLFSVQSKRCPVAYGYILVSSCSRSSPKVLEHQIVKRFQELREITFITIGRFCYFNSVIQSLEKHALQLNTGFFIHSLSHVAVLCKPS